MIQLVSDFVTRTLPQPRARNVLNASVEAVLIQLPCPLSAHCMGEQNTLMK